MSAPVDVLAVLRRMAGMALAMRESTRVDDARKAVAVTEDHEAIAAVAELIGSLKHARSTLATALRHAAPDLFETDADVDEHLAIKRIDAALSRAQGGAA